jgi:hypothetical protein
MVGLCNCHPLAIIYDSVYVISTRHCFKSVYSIELADIKCNIRFMMFFKKKFSVWMLAVWLVVLQVLSPFVHAHFEAGDHADQANGLHLHAISFNTSDKALDQSKHRLAVNDYAMNAHIVVIEKGLMQKLTLSDLSTALIAVFVFLVIPTNPPRLRSQKQFRLKKVYERGNQSPRAPPSY